MVALRYLIAHVAVLAVSGPIIAGLALSACTVNTPPPAAEQTAAPASEYVIGPGDTLNVFVYHAPELSAQLPVRPDGRLSLPLVPDIQAAGRTPTQLAQAIQERLKKYVIDPNVTVMVSNFVGPTDRQIRVIGEAAQPKALPYREGMTVLDVMIEVGGLTHYAAGNHAELIRRVPDKSETQVIHVHLSDLLRDGDISQDVRLQPGDTLIIPQSWF